MHRNQLGAMKALAQQVVEPTELTRDTLSVGLQFCGIKQAQVWIRR